MGKDSHSQGPATRCHSCMEKFHPVQTKPFCSGHACGWQQDHQLLDLPTLSRSASVPSKCSRNVPAAMGISRGQAPEENKHKKATRLGGFFINKQKTKFTSVCWLVECFTWHRAIFAGGCPPTIVAAAAFHARVRDGSGWDHSAMDTRIDILR